MAEPARDPDNLVGLRGVFGDIDALFTGDSITVDGIEFVSGYTSESTAERFYIVKPMHLIDRYRELCRQFHGGNIVELGIAEGGSTALMALWAEPKKLVAIDNEPSRLTALDEFIANRDLTDRIVPHYGVDQADTGRLRQLVADEFGDGELDLVIDDASHRYRPTLASFEALFPYVREGGTYLIEDWDADLSFMAAVARSMRRKAAGETIQWTVEQDPPPQPPAAVEPTDAEPTIPVARLAMRFVLACASQGRAISEIAMNRSFVAVTKGPEPLDPATFTLQSISPDHFNLVAPLEPPAS